MSVAICRRYIMGATQKVEWLAGIARKIGLAPNEIFLKLHLLALKIGIQVIPKHYYSSVADLYYLRSNRHLWQKKSTLPGIHCPVEDQVNALKAVCLPFQKEYRGNPYYTKAVSEEMGLGYGPIEAQALHGVVRHFKPHHIIEVGSGVSTYCSLQAMEMNGRGEILCIEPYPSQALKSLPQIRIMECMVQQTPLETFDLLESNDLLFIDSTHTVKPGSDVNYLVLEVLPRLRPGVIVHFHDIYLPYDYQIDILNNFFQWSETSLLRAFLIHNSKAKILFCMSHLHEERQDVLKDVFPDYEPLSTPGGIYEGRYPLQGHFPGSIYIRII